MMAGSVGIGRGTGDSRELAVAAAESEAAARERPLSRRNLAVVACLFVAALGGIFALQHKFHINSFGVSQFPHYVYQAESFLHGRWDVDLPRSLTDIVVLHGKDYTIYPPFPAVLLMPFVAVFGTATSDILFTAVISALNLGVLYLLLEQARVLGLTRRTWLENAAIAALLWVGSINLWLSLGGDMWYTAHIVGFTCALLSLLLALQRRFTLSAVYIGCGFLTRGTLALVFPLVLFLAWQEYPADNLFARFAGALRRREVDLRAVPWRRLAGPLVVFAVSVACFMLRNAAVFGNPLESGYNVIIHQRYPSITNGVFSLTYLKSNLVANFFDFPKITFQGPYDRHPVIDWLNGGVGISVFLTTPLFLLLFVRNQRFHPLRAALWVTVGLIVVSVLVFHATGYAEFGARYLFEAYPYAFLLLALGDERLDWRFVLLGLLGVAINLAGASQLWTFHPTIV